MCSGPWFWFGFGTCGNVLPALFQFGVFFGQPSHLDSPLYGWVGWLGGLLERVGPQVALAT